MGWQNYIKGMTFGNYPFYRSVEYSVVITILSVALILAVHVHGGVVHLPRGQRFQQDRLLCCACSP